MKTKRNKTHQIGDVMRDLASKPIIDAQSGEINIVALIRKRKETQK